MWSDNESEIDLLGFQHLSSAITSIIFHEVLLPTTIGVYGDWGSGKSSLLKMVQTELKNNPEVVVVPFNGWLFEGYEDAKTALMGTILDEISKQKKLVPQAKERIRKLINRVNVMQVIGSTTKTVAKAGLAYLTGGLPALGLSAGLDAAKLGHKLLEETEEKVDDADFEKFIKEDPGQNLRRGIREFRQDFAELLQETKIQTLVIIIDDLDRCMPDTIIETLEAIKLFLFVPHTAFIIGADERLVKYAVRRRFPELPGERAEVGRDYLEKLVQFPIRVPPLGRSELETYVNLLFFIKAFKHDSEEVKKARECVANQNSDSLLEVRFNLGIAKAILNQNLSPELEEDLSLAQRIAPILAGGLNGNPRQCKRFLNTLVIRTQMAKSRNVTLKQRVLAKLMLLEYFKPEFFKQLAEFQANQQGRPKELKQIEQQIDPTKVHEKGLDAHKSGNDKTKPGDKATDSAQIKQKTTSNGSTTNQPRSTSPSSSSGETVLSLAAWNSDNWMKEWLESNPPLADEDLRPYFFFSRDTLGSLGGSVVQRMTPKAQEIISELLQGSDAIRNNALKKSVELNQAEAAAVFEAIGEKVQQEEDLSNKSYALDLICEWVEVRRELFSQFITFVEALPEGDLPIKIVPKIINIAKEITEKNLVKKLLQKWANNSTAPNLKKVAAQRLENYN